LSRVRRCFQMIAAFVALMSTLNCIALSSSGPEESPQSTACATPEHHQFDFWIGDWDAFDFGTPNKVARTRVDRILSGWVLHESYEDPAGLAGESFTIYDPQRKLWHQSWVTNHGQLLVIEGRLKNGEIVLSGQDHSKSALVRGTWKPVDGGVRETAFTSSDNGTTWKPWFDLLFRAHTASADDPAVIVAALDKQYQMAVEKNDVATMDRILADDFTLVTGSGKSYSKADLLNEAKSGHVIYEQQDDSDRSVRVWGDTAIVTAKLHAKGAESGKPFDYSVWFSDTYIRTPTGWRYVFGQSSLRLPEVNKQ
jgi:ketosteroid isomerase-like protein